ncbi:hypothetical protein ACO22_05056 [Paracoccidioides brasiliensis]|uniref:Xylanolytic transcriptional activator regulatory domain-containing protein n=1 Tax=Paracoccidioides brasiliensis TaxID=121759 RepID=A0A1D2JBF8_PARBR|nr:hypothetical protein ACO22_05056 [Paracoccidioides brasiliensis]
MRGASERLHETWKSSELSADVEELLSNPGSTTMGPLLDRTHWIIELTNFHPVQKLEIQTLRQITLQSIEKRVKLHDVGQATGGELRVKLPFQTPHLLDMYFAYTHSWFPIVANHNILRTTYQYSAPSFQIERSTIGSGNHASLWPILSNTTSQISPSTEVNSTVLASFKDALQEAEEFYSIARSLIPHERGSFEIGHVHALSLLALVNIGFGDWTVAWFLCGQATSVSIDMVHQ